MLAAINHGFAGTPKWRVQQIENSLGVGYAVRVLDVNEDRQPDIVVVDQTRVLWYENPSWARHVLLQNKTKPDNVCIAPHDIDGDGKMDFALGADWRFTAENEGTIYWLKRASLPTAEYAIFPLGAEPFVHRMQWTDVDGDKKAELVVVPLLGSGATQPERMQKPVRVLAYKIPPDPTKDRWHAELFCDELHVAHNFDLTDLDGDGKLDILVGSFEGVSWLQRQTDGKWKRTLIGTGNQTSKPNRGVSEIRRGKTSAGDYIATIEPWHGFQVVVYTRPEKISTPLWRRQVLDEQLRWGHAVHCANVDDDADEELIVGVRDHLDDHHKSGVRIYDPGPKGWRQHRIDAGGVAVEDLAVMDLNGDGRHDIVAVGRQTHNIRIYWHEGIGDAP